MMEKPDANRFKVPYSHPRWWWENDFPSDCLECAHFRGMIKGKPRCEAFPDGISREIILSREPKHRTPLPGDHGIQFKHYQE